MRFSPRFQPLMNDSISALLLNAPEELHAFADRIAKQGGFGPLFGGTVLLAFLVFASTLINLWGLRGRAIRKDDQADSEDLESEHKKKIAVGLFFSALILSTGLINPASSPARFIPPMWLFPMGAFFLSYFSKNQLIRVVGYAIIMTLLLNNALAAFAHYKYYFEITRIYHQRLGKMASESQKNPIPFHFGHFRTSNIWRFERLGIRLEVGERKEECQNGERILPNRIVLKCNPE